MYKVLVIVGPTAIGKSSLAIELAKAFNGEIINGDSVSVYKELNIGSAKTLPEEQQGIPHHLIDYIDVEDNYDVSKFQFDARKAIEEISKKGKLPIVVGGTGLYIKALLEDYDFSQENKKENNYDQYTNEQLHAMLENVDKKSSEAIHPNNRKRVIRALEIASSGKTKSEIEENQTHTLLYDAKIIGLTMDRDRLKERIDRRVDQMIQLGLVNEVSTLFEKYSFDCHCFSAIGYKEFIGYYKNDLDLNECVEQVKTHTRQFAKRQYTWFNHQMKITWYDIEGKNFKDKLKEEVKQFING